MRHVIFFDLKPIRFLLLFLFLPFGLFAQTVSVTGTVKDTNGEGLIGVSVVEKGTINGILTDIDGKYSLNVQHNGILEFSYVGYVTQSINVQGKTLIDVALEEDLKSLSEVVVVGYGVMKKRDLTGALSSVGEDKIKGRSYSNAMQAVAGQVAGIQIQQVQGAPGFAPSIKIRGNTSINTGTNPLYVIDGIPLEDISKSSGQDNSADGGSTGLSSAFITANLNPLNYINPNDIESIEILKDASSAAIYGSRGANGVVLITTKQGKAGKTRVEANYEFGVSSVNRRVDMMNAKEWLAYESLARLNSGQSVPSIFSETEWLARIGNGTDWQDVLFRSGITHNAQVLVSGGSEKTQFMVSSNYLNSQGVVDNNDYERITVRSNLRHQISTRVKIGLNSSYARVSTNDVGTGGKADAISLSLQSAPVFPAFTENGTYGPYDPNSIWNAFNQAGILPSSLWHPYSMTREVDRNRLTSNAMINAYLEWTIIDDLVFKTSLSDAYNNMRYQSYQTAFRGYGWPGATSQTNAKGRYNTGQTNNWVFENTLNYNKTFGSHSITGLLGYTMQENKYEESFIESNSFPNDMVHTLNAGKVANALTFASEWALISYIARATYSYQGKYLASASIRADGSSRFGVNNHWGYFPSASIGWRISEESFLKNTNWLNNLKVRLSYGETGNNQVGDYSAIGLLGYVSYPMNGTVTQGMFTNTYPDKNLTWEKTRQVNIGFDASFFNQRIDVSLDYYQSQTRDLLFNVPIPAISGFSETLTNIGKLGNKGLEFNLNTRNIEGDFSWRTNFNISGNRNKILELGNNNAPFNVVDFDANVRFEVGKPMAYFYGYELDGVIMTTADLTKYPVWPGSEAGDPKVVDVNGDGKIDADDRTMIGSAQPDFVWGMTNTFSYKGIDLSVMLSGSQGNEIFNQNARYLKRYNGSRGAYQVVANYWKSEAEPGNGQIPKPRANANTVQNLATSYWVEDGSFVRIKNIQLGYTLPQKLTSHYKLSAVKLYVNMENVYVFSDYLNYDPESSTYTTGNLVGLDFGSYPNPFVCTFGVNLSF
ncbi:MAG: TonB-dependent receptor [Dysgonamonadaceae bacterium]|jgi:TonB-linked SusC/RagA family outer membrane protein|nr:TonB-dependent receptor [Dysgonamonadaceae bacterium]